MVKHSSRIELSQKALQGNINFIKKQIGSDTELSGVIKANAYGHGISTYLPMAEKAGVRHFSVASAHEAEEALAVACQDSRIMIMGILYEEDIPWAIEHGVEFYVFNKWRMPVIAKAAQKLKKRARIHLEVETGANRTGLSENYFLECLDWIEDKPDCFEFEGMCTHFGGAETFSNDFKIKAQHQRFNEYYALAQNKGCLPKKRHLASSAAALSYAASRYEMVRVGVAQYGFWPSPDVYYWHLAQNNRTKENGLRRLFTWKTDVMDVRPVPEGEYIGYGTAYQATRDMTIAVLPLGYSNGYPRGLSNRGQVLIRGQKAPICGLVNMNLFMVDVSHIDGVKSGDEVVLIGRQGNQHITVASFSETTALINQEMMSRLPAAIPRHPVA